MQVESDRRAWGVQPAKAFGQRFWIGLALLSAAIITIAAVFWIFDHPYGTNWDEARYINRAYRDVALFHQGGIAELLKGLVGEDRTRPAAYRLLVLPLTLLTGVNAAGLRLISLAVLLLSLWLTFLIGRRIAGTAAGAFAVAFLILCPIVVAPGMRFYVDYPFYLAIAATLYFLILDWNREPPSRHWIGLGLAMGLGIMSKPPFLFVAAPMLLLTLLLRWRNVIAGPTIPSLLKAGAVGTLVALPWWIFNFKPALAKAFKSGGYVRHSLGPKGSPEALGKWLYVFVQTMLGPALTLLVLAVLVTVLLRLVRKQLPIDTTQVTAIALCLSASLPLLATSAFATNQNPRLVAPALLPLAIAIGALAALTGWTTSRWLAATATALLCFQLAVMVSPSPNEPRYQTGDDTSKGLLWGNPTTVMRRSEQWDWSKLRDLALSRNIRQPAIAYLGASGGLTAPQIGSPWVMANEPAAVRWLWKFERGPFNWDKVMELVNASHIVVTAVDVTGSTADKQDVDNQYNAELVQRLQNSPQFDAPVELKLGRFDPARVIVFLRKSEMPPVALKDPQAKDTLPEDLF